MLKSVLGGVDGYSHFLVPSMNRLNQIDPATFTLFSFFLDDDVSEKMIFLSYYIIKIYS
jgi:hypothetical protein